MDQVRSKNSRRACAFCRKRKLRCDRVSPCGSCQKFGFDCQYNSILDGRISKSVGKPSKITQLENRLGQVEQLLQLQSATEDFGPTMTSTPKESCWPSIEQSDDLAGLDLLTIHLLEQAYFDFIHPVINLIHMSTYTNTMATPPCYLRHAIWALGALKLDAYAIWSERLYRSSSRKLEETELKDSRFDRVTLAQAQTVVLIATYELHEGYFHSAWMSVAKAVRLVQVLKLHRLDGKPKPNNVFLGPIDTCRDVIEVESGRRAFWHTFLLDRYCFVSTKSPPLIQLNDIYTFLPASDDAFANGHEETYMSLPDALGTTVSQPISSLAACVVLLSQSVSRHQDLDRSDVELAGKDLSHVEFLSQPDKFQKALTTEYHVPEHLNLGSLLLDPGLAYLHTATSTATITIHLAALVHIQDNFVPPETWLLGNKQCIQAAAHILQVLDMTSTWDPRSYHFLTLYSIYSAVAALANSWLVEPQASDENSIHFLLNKLELFKKSVRLAGVLLQDIDIEFPGLRYQLASQKDSTPLPRSLSNNWEFRQIAIDHDKEDQIAGFQEQDHSLRDVELWALDDEHSHFNVSI